MSDEAVKWLREQVQARLAQARALAIASKGGDWAATLNGDFDWTVFTRSDAGLTGVDAVADMWRADVAAYLVANDPRQIIADCEADLEVLREHHILWRTDCDEKWEEFSVVSVGGASKDFGCVTCHYYGMGGVKGYGYCVTIRAFAARFRHRPGYTEHWSEVAVAGQ